MGLEQRRRHGYEGRQTRLVESTEKVVSVMCSEFDEHEEKSAT